jgi:hypothetical protein
LRIGDRDALGTAKALGAADLSLVVSRGFHVVSRPSSRPSFAAS